MMFTARDASVMVNACKSDALERAAEICERMRPPGGRAWTDEQNACFNALTAAADAIRELKDEE